MKIAFVVLHYENITDTYECLESLKMYRNDDVYVIVVDNGSKVEPIDKLQINNKEKNIIFIKSNDNLGFAKGNNIGFEYAKNELNAEVIILANNDLVFKQDDFIEKLIYLEKTTKFDVAGPRIISMVDGKNQNPVPVLYKSIKDINIRIFKTVILLLTSMIDLDVLLQRKIAEPIQEFFPTSNEDYQLHGACMIFANRYVEECDGLYEKTFMYNEESILKEFVKQKGMNMKYFEDIEVFHKEGAATESVLGKGKKKRQFYYKWNLHSIFLLKSLKQDFNKCVKGFNVIHNNEVQI